MRIPWLAALLLLAALSAAAWPSAAAQPTSAAVQPLPKVPLDSLKQAAEKGPSEAVVKADLPSSILVSAQGEKCFRTFVGWRDNYPQAPEGSDLPCPFPTDASRARDCSGLLALGQECLQAAVDYQAARTNKQNVEVAMLRWYERCGVKVSCADCVAKVGESKILVAGPLPGPQPVTQLPEAKQLPAGQVLQAAVGGQP